MFASTYSPIDANTIDAQPDSTWTASLEGVAPGVVSIIEQQRAPTESWVDALGRLLPVIASTYQQKQLLDVQVERARNGLAPLDASQYAPGVRVGLAPDTQRLLMYGGLALLALLAYMAMQRR